MKTSWNSITQNLLFKVSSANAIAVMVKLITGIVSSKFIAVFIGAEGLPFIGNLRNLVNALQSISVLGIYNGVVKYVSELKSNNEELSKVIASSLLIATFVSVTLALGMYFFAGTISDYVFTTKAYTKIIKWVALSLPFYALSVISLGIINGYAKYRAFVFINILASILGLVVTLTLIWFYNLQGALFAVISMPLISFLFTILFLFNKRSTVILQVSGSFAYVKKLLVYAMMALVTALLVPFVHIEIRNMIMEQYQSADAGYWEAMQRLSNHYIVFFTSLFTLYLLPKLARLENKKAFRKEVFYVYKNLLPLFGIGLILLYLLKKWVVLLFLSEEFLPMLSMFKWYLIGDFLKIASMVISYQLIAKKMFWEYVITEVLSVLVLYVLSSYWIKLKGFEGASMAHLAHYMFYFVMMLVVFRKTFFSPEKEVQGL